MDKDANGELYKIWYGGIELTKMKLFMEEDSLTNITQQ